MNFSGIIGLLAGIGLIVYGILGDGSGVLKDFLDPPSAAITIGGTIACLLFSFPFSTIAKVPKLIWMVMKPPKYNPREKIDQIVEYCKIARSRGLLALENSAEECKDPFMKSSLLLLVDGTDAEKAQAILEDAIAFLDERHASARAVFDRGVQAAPGFGMIGTLIGLVNMLGNLGGDSADGADLIGKGMATALITTFYGSILSNLVFGPISSRLKTIHDQEVLCMEIIKEGVLAIQVGTNPRNVQEKLEFMLPKAKPKKGKQQEGEAAAESAV